MCPITNLLAGPTFKRTQETLMGIAGWRKGQRGHAWSLRARAAAMLCLLAACAGPRVQEPLVHQFGGPPLTVSPGRLAVIAGPSSGPMVDTGYSLLEARTAEFFRTRLGSQVVERSEMNVILAEQVWQHRRGTDESSIINLGRLLGADALMLYRIRTPRLRERLFAEAGDLLPPVTILAKLVRVETGEDLWTRVVTVEVRRHEDGSFRGLGFDADVWRAVANGVDEMLQALEHAVLCAQSEDNGWPHCRSDDTRPVASVAPPAPGGMIR